MRRVEPFLKLDAPVLDYQAPLPPKSLFEQARDLVEPAVDFVGGWEWAMLIVAIGFICIGVSIPGPVGAAMVMIGAVLIRALLKYWSKSSRW